MSASSGRKSAFPQETWTAEDLSYDTCRRDFLIGIFRATDYFDF